MSVFGFTQVTDADVKVAYIYRFTDYVEWPENKQLKFFTIGVYDDSELMTQKLEYLANNRKIKNQKIKIVKINQEADLITENLNLLYIGKNYNENISEIHSAIKGNSTLLVTDNCAVKEALMINFLPSEKESIVRFEINKKNAVDEQLIIKPDILLLGGTFIDVRKLFQEKEQELVEEKNKVKQSQEQIAKQSEIIKSQDVTIALKETVISDQNNEISKQKAELNQQKAELNNLATEIDKKQLLLNSKITTLKKQENKIISQQEDILKTKIELDKQKDKLIIQENQIAKQEEVLFKQLTQIQLQRNLMFGFIAIIMLILSLAYFIYRSFRIKKHANIQLEKYNKEIEAANLELEKLSIVASKTHNAVVITNKDAEIEWINEGFTRLFGYEYQDLIYKFGKNLISDFSNNLVEQKLAECRKTKKTVEYLALNKTKWGKKLWMHTTLTPILDEQGEIKKLIILEANVTELKIAEENNKKQKEEIEEQNTELENYRNHLEQLVEQRTEQLLLAKEKAEESNRLKSSFIANLSHEIRTPMNAVLGFSRILTARQLTEEKTAEYINLINSNAKSLMRLIDDLIELSNIETGKLFVKKSDCDIHAMLSDLYLIYNEKIKKDNPQIELVLSKALDKEKHIIYSDRLRINQVLINLLDNAIKFTPSGKIEFGYQINENSDLQFYVKDTGIGIEKEKQQLIFERFSKIESRKDILYRGTGLGLSICRSIITALNGYIGVESQLEIGSTFYFTIPIKKHQRKVKATTPNLNDVNNS